MTAFHVRYWFDSNSASRSGEQVIEMAQGKFVEEVMQTVQARLRNEPDFTITPAFGMAAQRRVSDAVGLVLIRSSHVRFMEVFPVAVPAAEMNASTY
ncbi:MAG: hypothetical protein V4671_23640 [Armatimonadota bacterium]